ncbi:hypothetical protein ACIGGE_16270 [Qipengyuania sp. NPDC077410]|uniref:hypothetical protein n=1 Tax=Qipengyuania sp. NPDC077410 TaxID=3364496 RepID=UPI0037C7AA29
MLCIHFGANQSSGTKPQHNRNKQMALEFLKLTDSKLAEDFNKADPETYMPKRREKVARLADRAAKAAKEKKARGPLGTYAIKNNAARVSVRMDKETAFPLWGNGKVDHDFMPAERVSDFYEGVAKSARAGELDSHFDWEPEKEQNQDAGAGGRTMSEEHRKAISEAAKKRWAEKKAKKQPA